MLEQQPPHDSAPPYLPAAGAVHAQPRAGLAHARLTCCDPVMRGQRSAAMQEHATHMSRVVLKEEPHKAHAAECMLAAAPALIWPSTTSFHQEGPTPINRGIRTPPMQGLSQWAAAQPPLGLHQPRRRGLTCSLPTASRLNRQDDCENGGTERSRGITSLARMAPSTSACSPGRCCRAGPEQEGVAFTCAQHIRGQAGRVGRDITRS